MNAVTAWFGDDFSRLHPLLQTLHQDGGILSGIIAVQYGQGLSKFIGRRLASKLGIPLIDGNYDLKVEIHHSSEQLFWNRIFCDELRMNSIFTPHGSFECGYWREDTGNISLELGVDVIDGGWYWTQRKMMFRGIRD